MAKYIMALDQGTTSSRCILFDKAGNICSMAQREFEQIYPKPGWVEHNPMEIWSTQYAVMSEAMALVGAKPKDIAGIGITNQRETTIVWDKETGSGRRISNACRNRVYYTCGMFADRKYPGIGAWKAG